MNNLVAAPNTVLPDHPPRRLLTIALARTATTRDPSQSSESAAPGCGMGDDGMQRVVTGGRCSGVHGFFSSILVPWRVSDDA